MPQRGEIRTPSEIQIRRATPQDAIQVAQVLYESFLEFKPLYTPEAFSATTPHADQVLARMREGPVWIALRGAEAVGTVAAVVKRESVYMRGMAVLPSARRLNVGARLLGEVERVTSSEGCTRIYLSTTPFLKAAIRLYEMFGFRRIEEGPGDLLGTPLFTMEKNIVAKS
jgi:GNAT superfamily N-acetyltransferase